VGKQAIFQQSASKTVRDAHTKLLSMTNRQSHNYYALSIGNKIDDLGWFAEALFVHVCFFLYVV